MQHRKFKSLIRSLITFRRRAYPTPTALTTARLPTSEPEPAERPAVVEEVQTEFYNVDLADTAVVATIVESFVKAACDGLDINAFAVFSAPTQETERQELLAAVSEALASCEYDDFEPVSVDGIFAPTIVHGFEDYIIFSSYSILFVVLWTDTRTLELFMLETEDGNLWVYYGPSEDEDLFECVVSSTPSVSLSARAEGVYTSEWRATCVIVSPSLMITTHSGDGENYTKLTRVEAVTPQGIADTLRLEMASWEYEVFSSASELLALCASGALEPEQVYKDARGGGTLESFVAAAPDSVLKILSEAQ
jgi:hypothetical protein